MSASTTAAGAALSRPSGMSRVYGLGSVFAKSLRDSTRATLIAGIGIALIVLATIVQFQSEFSTPEARRQAGRALGAAAAHHPGPPRGAYQRPHAGGLPVLADPQLRAAHARRLVHRRPVGDDRQRGASRQPGCPRVDAHLARPDRGPQGRGSPRRDGAGLPRSWVSSRGSGRWRSRHCPAMRCRSRRSCRTCCGWDSQP